MKKILKATTKKNFKKLNKLNKSNNLFIKDVISLDDKKNKKYLDNFVYQEYLKSLNTESSDVNE